MKIEDIKRMAQAWNQVQEATYGKSKKEAMDPVDAKELKGKHKDRKDKDIDNDGDVDSSDEYLHNRRKAVSKAIKGKSSKDTTKEVVTSESSDENAIARAKLDTFLNNMKNGKLHPATKKRPPTQYVIKNKKDVQKEEVEELDEAVHSVFIDHEGDQDPDAFKHKITLKHHGRGAGATATGKKKNLQKYLTKHYVGREDAKDAHPEVFESVALDELSKKTLGSYIKKADKQADKAADSYSNAAMRRSDFAPDTPAMAKNAKKFAKRDAGADLARRKLAKESKDHGNMNNGSPSGEGLSPSAKKELDRTTPMNPATDQPTVDKKTFDAIRASGKKAPMRSNDNAQGDKTPPKAGK